MIKSRVNKSNKLAFWLLVFFIVYLPPLRAQARVEKMPEQRLQISAQTDQETGLKESRGFYRVYENREKQTGKILNLGLVVFHAKKTPAQPDPLFLLAGGPGVAAVETWGSIMKESPYREDRDVVLVNQRGTGDNHRLFCDMSGGDDSPQGHLESAFRLPVLRECLERLKAEYNLSQYSNPIAMDDLDEVRTALGYKKINLMGFSGGTRAALIYIRRHPESVRTAILNGVVPLAFTNPLFHASASQDALENLFTECAADPSCHDAFPDLEKEFYEILDRLKKHPAKTTISHPGTGDKVQVTLERNDFAESVRMMLYRLPSNRRLPYLIHNAHRGDFAPFAQRAVQTNRGINKILSMGMLLCVTCAEDVDRITEEGIVRETKGTFMGDVRVREQQAACAIWPRSVLPDLYASPVKSGIPVLLFSGSIDPVTPARFADVAAKNLSNSLHLVVPGTHGVFGDCLSRIEAAFLKTGAVTNLDTGCVSDMKLPPLFVPEGE